MSLATLLDRLTGLLPKYFIAGAFLPALIFGFLNGAVAYGDSPRFRAWAQAKLLSGTPGIFESAAVLIGLAVVAYVFSSVNGFLREVLEGKHLLSRSDKLRTRFEARQREKYAAIVTDYSQARDEGARIADSSRRWRDDLSDAAVHGLARSANRYTAASPAAVEIERLRQCSRNAEAIPYRDLDNAVTLLEAELSANNIRIPGPGGVNLLAEDRRSLLRLIDYAEDAWAARRLDRFNERSRYGAGHIAPTAMGNVAASMQGYGLTRYGMNLETFWTRLQPILAAGNKDFYGGIQDAKTQLDFLVACFWLNLFSAAVWLPVLAVGLAPWWLFVAVAAGGPSICLLCYALAVQSYIVFTELVRSSVDLYRFPLLQALHVALPGGIREERAIWNALQRLSTFGEEAVDLSYQHDAKGGGA
jgi:hypothetical protein